MWPQECAWPRGEGGAWGDLRDPPIHTQKCPSPMGRGVLDHGWQHGLEAKEDCMEFFVAFKVVADISNTNKINSSVCPPLCASVLQKHDTAK